MSWTSSAVEGASRRGARPVGIPAQGCDLNPVAVLISAVRVEICWSGVQGWALGQRGFTFPGQRPMRRQGVGPEIGSGTRRSSRRPKKTRPRRAGWVLTLSVERTRSVALYAV